VDSLDVAELAVGDLELLAPLLDLVDGPRQLVDGGDGVRIEVANDRLEELFVRAVDAVAIDVVEDE
jgi:hypothetical protein